jgi:hypothetical protein
MTNLDPVTELDPCPTQPLPDVPAAAPRGRPPRPQDSARAA